MAKQFFFNNIDYITFVYGAMLMMWAAMALIHSFQVDRRLRWGWLGFYAFAIGFDRWLGLMPLLKVISIESRIVHLILLLFALVCLMEFARSGLIAVRGRGPGVWIHAPFLALTAIGSLTGFQGLEASATYALGIPGFIGSVYVVWRRRQEDSLGKGSLLVFIILFSFYGLIEVFCAAKADFVPIVASLKDLPVSFAGIPKTLIQSILAGILGFCLGRYYILHKRAELASMKVSIGSAKAIWLIAMLALILAVGWGATLETGVSAGTEERSQLLALTKSCAGVFSLEPVGELTGSESDLESGTYRLLKRQFRKIKEANPSIRFVYLMGMKNEKVIFLVDAENENSKDYSAPGEIYDEASPELIGLFSGGSPFVEGPLEDRYGIWISGLVPLSDPATNRVLGVMGIDIDASHLTQKMRQERRQAILIVMMIASLAIVFGIAWMQDDLAKARMLAGDRRFRIIAEQTGQMTYDWDISTGRIAWAGAVSRITGFSEEQFESVDLERWKAMVYPEDRKSTVDLLEKTMKAGQPFGAEYRLECADGSYVYVQDTGMYLQDENGKSIRMLGSINDISERKKVEDVLRQNERELQKLAFYDVLTGLPNRHFFEERLNQAVAQSGRTGKPVALMFLDLDNFKIVNDSLGHRAGDTLLQEVAHRLGEVVRKTDTVARLGGDEFTVILTNLSEPHDAIRVAEKIRQAMSPPILIGSHQMHVTTSIGIAMHPLDADDVETLLKYADMAMYGAKKLGKNKYQFFSSDLNSEVIERILLERAVRVALAESEFRLHYQPRVDMETGRIVCMEALLRWNNKEWGKMCPEKVVPLAEETGLIIPIGEWVLQEACAQTCAWQKAGRQDLAVSVNVSARQFADPSFIRIVERALDLSGLESRFLEIEITESTLMQDSDDSAILLERLRAMGVRISVDDFGTGYSSMNYLRRFSIDMLKIDRSFVINIPNRDDLAIIELIITLADKLDLGVVAEGVETAQQAEILKQLGCRQAQGFYYYQPVPPDKFELGKPETA